LFAGERVDGSGVVVEGKWMGGRELVNGESKGAKIGRSNVGVAAMESEEQTAAF
jgi:hypothetical protein